MNAKTTIALAFVLVVSVFALYVVRSSPTTDEPSTAPSPTSTTARDLIEVKLGDVVNVSVRRKGEDEWVFEKSEPEGGGTAEWRMTAPLDMKVVRWEVDRLPRQLGNLQYEISYEPGEAGGVTAEKAGLDPPEATITLTDAEGKSATVEIGKPASAQTTYVRLAGSDRICVGKSNMRNLLKPKPLEYRDQQLWTFDVKNVTRLEITVRDSDPPTEYVFVPQGSGWVIERPVSAKATQKVADAVRELSRLRAIAWIDNDASKLPVYGLDPTPLAIRVTVEEEIAPEPDTDGDSTESEAADDESGDDEDAAPRIETRVYEVHVSNRSPIGEDTKVYLGVGDGPVVATVMKTTADKLRPVLDEWRDMRVATAEVTSATHIELSTAGEQLVLDKKDGNWLIEPGGERAENDAVADLLTEIRDLTAVTFVEATSGDSSMGFDTPKADILLTIPGTDGVERITIGRFTDPTTRRLVYVQRNGGTPVAKVRSSDIDTLLQKPVVYRDRSVFNLPTGQIERVALSLQTAYFNERVDITLARDGDTWSMIEPVSAEVRADRVGRLVDGLASLHADAVVAEGDELSAFGLHDPAAVVEITRKPPVEYRVEEPDHDDETGEADSGEEDTAEDSSAKPVAHQPPSETFKLLATEHDGRYFAKRSDRPLIYEIPSASYTQLFVEYRTDTVLSFEADAVVSFAIQQSDVEHVFVRRDDKWVYQAEPDLPLDSKKVEDLLLRIRDIKTSRYVRHVSADLSALGLDTPYRRASISLEDGTILALRVSSERPRSGSERGFYATTDVAPGVFLLSDDVTTRMAVSLDQLE